MEKSYQLKLGKPFIIKEIDNLFYACTYINTKLSFLMEKEKFDKLINRGLIKEYRKVSSF